MVQTAEDELKEALALSAKLKAIESNERAAADTRAPARPTVSTIGPTTADFVSEVGGRQREKDLKDGKAHKMSEA